MGVYISRDTVNLNKVEPTNVDMTYMNAVTKEFHFTRYIYEKDEVKINIIINLLNKKEDAVYWAYELYYSGLNEELCNLLWSIYYDFYAVLNPSFEKYLSSKMADILTLNLQDNRVVSMIIHNFIIRPYSLDVFMMRHFVKIFDFEKCSLIVDYISTNNFKYISDAISSYLEKEDYMILASLFLVEINEEHLLDAFNVVIKYFNKLDITPTKEYKNIKKIEKKYTRVAIYSRILMYFIRLKNMTIPQREIIKKIKFGRNVYVHIDLEEIVMYETILADNKYSDKSPKTKSLPARKILQAAAIYPIDEGHYLSLFMLKRDKNNIVTAYREKWLYYASFSPIWIERIKRYNGKINHISKTVEFEDYDSEECFYELFGYEPDEQILNIQEKSIAAILKKRNWKDFYDEHKQNSLIDIDDEYLMDIDKIEYQII